MFNQIYNAKADTGDPDPYQGGAPAASKLIKNTFYICPLTESDIPAFLTLQKTVRDALPDDQKHYLKERTAEDLADHLRAGMPLLGIKTALGQLVGQALISFPDNKAAKNIEGYPVHGLEGSVALVQSVAVHPNFRGKEYGLAAKLQGAIVETAQDYHRPVLMAKVADSNEKSQNSFLNSHFTVAAEGIDPAKGYGVKYFAKDISLNGFMYGAASSALALKSEMT
jgi:hypothetical protein